MNNLLNNEIFEISRQLILNKTPFNNFNEVNDYYDKLKDTLGSDIFKYQKNLNGEILLNVNNAEKIFDANILPELFNPINLYKFIGLSVYITEESLSKKTVLSTYNAYASCIAGLCCPPDSKNILYKKTKNKIYYLNRKFTILSDNIFDPNIINKFIDWLNIKNIDDIQIIDNNNIKCEIFNYIVK